MKSEILHILILFVSVICNCNLFKPSFTNYDNWSQQDRIDMVELRGTQIDKAADFGLQTKDGNNEYPFSEA